MKWQTVSGLIQNYMSNLFSKGRLLHNPSGFSNRLSFASHKYVKKCFCLFAVTKGIASSVFDEIHEQRFFKKMNLYSQYYMVRITT